MSHDGSGASPTVPTDTARDNSRLEGDESPYEALVEAVSDQLDLHSLKQRAATSHSLLRLTTHRIHHAVPPAHHVLAPASAPKAQGLAGWLTGWTSGAADGTPPIKQQARTIGFRNPWPSWHKPTLAELWAGLDWASASPSAEHEEEGDGSNPVDHLSSDEESLQVVQPVFADPSSPPNGSTAGDWQRSEHRLGATWLGHAGVLLQLPGLRVQEAQTATPSSGVEPEPIRFLFDPIFSERCSPTQYFGPARTYAPPCAVKDLPGIDAVLISHSHYDHLDLSSITELWARHKDRLRFIVPLGLKQWFVGAGENSESDDSAGPLGIPPDRVVELDWWDSVTLEFGNALATLTGQDDPTSHGSSNRVNVTCTPAQHGSGRYGLDAGTSLWASWFIEHVHGDDAPKAGPGPSDSGQRQSYKVFFGGDTGLQFHGAESPKDCFLRRKRAYKNSIIEQVDRGGPNGAREVDTDEGNSSKGPTPGTTSTPADASIPSTSSHTSEIASAPAPQHPPCPAFSEIALRLGSPDLLFLPISVGATLSFLKSYDLPALRNALRAPSDGTSGPDADRQGWHLFPDISPGLTSANHMGPWDACRVLNMMRYPGQPDADLFDFVLDAKTASSDQRSQATAQAASRRAPLAIGIHWGTFVSGEAETRASIRDLKEACAEQNITFSKKGGGARSQSLSAILHGPSSTAHARPEFVVVDHGHTLWLDM